MTVVLCFQSPIYWYFMFVLWCSPGPTGSPYLPLLHHHAKRYPKLWNMTDWTQCHWCIEPYNRSVRQNKSCADQDIYVAPVSAVILRQAKIRAGGEARCSEANPGWDCKETAHLHPSSIWRQVVLSRNVYDSHAKIWFHMMLQTYLHYLKASNISHSPSSRT